MLALLCATAAFTAPSLVVPRTAVQQPRVQPTVTMKADALGRRAAFLALAALPTLPVHADAIEEIAKRNAAAAAAEKSPEALAKKKAEEDSQENNQVLASAGITILLLGSTALSFPASGTDKNVARLGKKIITGKEQRFK